MTYSHNRHQSLFQPTTHPQTARGGYTAALTPVRRSLLAWLWVWVCRMVAIGEAEHRAKQPRPGRAFIRAAFMVLFILRFMPGSRQQKNALVVKMINQYKAKRLALYDKLIKAYVIWRQRKCWMWGSGFMNGALETLPNVFAGADDENSFDALIPD